MPDEGSLSPPRVLIAEDNYLIAEEVERIVRNCGYGIAGSTPSVERGLAMVLDSKPDAAVLDIDLAGRPSFPIGRALVAQSVPFLFLSGYSATRVPAEFGSVPYLAKPFEASVLTATLRGLLGDVLPATPVGKFGNTLLDTLPEIAKAAMSVSLERVRLRRGEILETPGQAISYVYFPVESMISVFAGTSLALRIEVTSIGHDGMTPVAIVLGDREAYGQAIVQAAGGAWRIPADRLRDLTETNAALRRHLLAHVGDTIRRFVDTVSYSGRATIVQRLAHWLLQSMHHLDSRQLNFTHEALAEILGVRRPSVSLGMQQLEGERFVRSSRSTITILDPEGLARRAAR